MSGPLPAAGLSQVDLLNRHTGDRRVMFIKPGAFVDLEEGWIVTGVGKPVEAAPTQGPDRGSFTDTARAYGHPQIGEKETQAEEALRSMATNVGYAVQSVESPEARWLKLLEQSVQEQANLSRATHGLVLVEGERNDLVREANAMHREQLDAMKADIERDGAMKREVTDAMIASVATSSGPDDEEEEQAAPSEPTYRVALRRRGELVRVIHVTPGRSGVTAFDQPASIDSIEIERV